MRFSFALFALKMIAIGIINFVGNSRQMDLQLFNNISNRVELLAVSLQNQVMQEGIMPLVIETINFEQYATVTNHSKFYCLSSGHFRFSFILNFI